MGKKGYLVLENGKIFEGISFGAEKDVDGEVVFNTGMVGYPEGFTDPSYYGQILTMTYPLIGNYGVPTTTSQNGILSHFESERIKIKGLIVSSYVENNTHWQSSQTLASWLKKEGVPALSGIDTRTLTKILREFGVAKGRLTFKKPRLLSGFIFKDINAENLVQYVSCKKPTVYGRGKFRILLIDCGVKLSIIKILLRYKTTIIRVPWDYNPFQKGSDLKLVQGLTPFKTPFEALVISNGPGDPKNVTETIKRIRQGMEAKIPILGICLGNQILALAAGADTYKLKYGHRSQNQPVKDELTNKCFVTTQNHGFATDAKSLPPGWRPWFTNLNDSTNEGIRHVNLPFFSIQFHPEASPGPTDTEWIIEYFISEAKKWLRRN